MIKQHTHILVRWKKRFGETYYKCDDPDCTYSASKSFLQGKRTLCAICRQTDFILTSQDLKRAKPRCTNCSGRAEDKARRKLRTIVEGIFQEQGQGGSGI